MFSQSQKLTESAARFLISPSINPPQRTQPESESSMSTRFTNPLKHKLQAGERTVGAWLQLASPLTAEIMSRAGFDWLMIDMEHGPGDIMTLIAQLQAMNGSNVTGLVRTPWNDFVMIKRILDAGAAGVLVPYVNTQAEAEAAVRACKYPPAGVRGIAGSPRAAGYGQAIMDYLRHANDEIFVMTAVETPTAVANLDAILTVPGLDAIFIGPMDLATSMGYFGDPSQPAVQSVIGEIETKVLASGKALGTIANAWEQAERLYARGYQMVMVMADGTALAKTAAEAVARFRALPGAGDG
ncbi:MAG: aldolase/citrate lyase family protein [Chloroflexota bacterium]|nr:aldolase/citrate lyase family protein [Chloroflexota bacterium]